MSISASSIARPFLQEVQQSASEIASKLSRKPKLLGLLANADGPSAAYARSTGKAATDAGMEFELVTIGSKEDPSQPFDVEQAIIEANVNDGIDGIMTYFPVSPSNEALAKSQFAILQIFDPAEDQYLQQVVSPSKDVEGLHFFFRFNLYHNIRFIQPASLSSGKTPPLGSC